MKRNCFRFVLLFRCRKCYHDYTDQITESNKRNPKIKKKVGNFMRFLRFQKLFLVVVLAVLVVSTSAFADSDIFSVPATLLGGFYQNGTSLDEMISNDGVRSLTTIVAFLDYCEYESKPDVVTDQTYIGKDKNGEILWIGLGGEKSSVVLMYSPENDPYHYSAVPVQFSGEWIPSFIDLYCDPLYQNSEKDIKSTLEGLSSLVQ